MYLGFMHLHSRKRVEPFPSRAPTKRLLDYLMYGVALLAPLALAPQVYSIYATREVGGLVLSSWAMLGTVNALWVVYGVTHRSPPLILSNIVFLCLHLAGVAGVFLYR
jgi:uncharacterized protein with PQ loop repeat